MPSRVLVVDDSPTIRKVVGGILARAGFEIGTAGDGAQALVALKREKFDLALVDFVMPKLNGFELCRKLREDDELKALPVVLMSVKADKIRHNFLRQTGAIDAITKPFDPRALVMTVEEALKKVGEGKVRRDPSVPPPGEFPPESTLVDSGGPPTSLRAVPDEFVTKLAEAVARISGDEGDAGATLSRVRRTLGEDGLATLYADLVGASAKAVLSGDLVAIPLAEVLQLLQLQRQSGVLTIYNATIEVQISLREGLIDLATSRGAADEFRLGRYLIEAGLLDRKALDAFLDAERERPKRRLLGDALVAEGTLKREELHRALSRQTSELIYDVLRWTMGRFLFDVKASKAEAAEAQLGLPVASIVMEGFRRVDEWRLMEGTLGDFDAVFYKDATALDSLGSARLTREERMVLEAVDGDRSVRELVGAVQMGSFDVCKILYQLAQSRLVRRRVA
jgi:CheY-like chemotaxis protein